MRPENRSVRRSWVKHHKRRNYLVLGLVTALLILIIVAFSASPPPTGAQIGQQAPDFTLADINNANFHLFEQKGKPVLLEFMTTSCRFCTEQAPILSELWTRHGSHVAFVSISVDPARDTPSVLSAYAVAPEHIMPWTWIRDTSGIDQSYGITGTPTVFLLDRDSVVKSRFNGLTNLQTLDNGVQAIL